MTHACDPAANQHYSRGIALYDHGLYTEAIVEFERVLEAVPDSLSPAHKLASFYMGEAYVNLGLAHMRMNMLKRAEEELNFALMLHPQYADLHFHLAVIYYREERYEDAEAEFQRALGINPKYAKAMMYLGVTRLVRGQSAGLMDIARAAECEPAYCGEKYDKAVETHQQGNCMEAVRLFEQVAEMDVDAIGYHMQKGRELLQNELYQEAGSAFLDAIEACPHYADLRNYLGTCYMHQGMIDLAIGQFSKALEINPGFVGARLNLATAHEANGDLDLCAQELTSVLELQPRNPEAERRLAEIEKNRGA